MSYYLLKLFYLLLAYLIIFLFLFFYSSVLNYFYPNKKKEEFIFLKKLYDNQTYFFTDFISDTPFLLKWLSCFFIWEFAVVYSGVFIIFLIIKPIQFFFIILYLPFYFFYFLFYFLSKKEIKYNGFIKHNTSLKDMFFLLFFYIPTAYLFTKFYRILKIINNFEKKNNFNLNIFLQILMHVSYRFFYKILFGLPLWNFYLIHQITHDILENYEKYFENKEKKSAPILTKIKYTLIGSHQKSYVYSAWRSRIYFVKNKPCFNPIKKIIYFIESKENDFVLKKGITHSNKLFKNNFVAHTIIEDIETAKLLKKYDANFSIPPVFTKAPLPGQRGFFFYKYMPRKDEFGNSNGFWFKQWVVTNNCFFLDSIENGATSSFINYDYENQQCHETTILHRLMDEGGVVLQNRNGCIKHAFPKKKFYEALFEHGIQIENASMVNLALKQIEEQKEALHYLSSENLIKKILFKNSLGNEIKLRSDNVFLPSRNKNIYIASYENKINNDKLIELENKTTDLDYINKTIKDANAETWEKYDYKKDYQDLFDLKKFKD